MTNADDRDPTARLTHSEVEVPPSPEQVWQAIATGTGNAAWLFVTEIEARQGGAMVIHREPFGGHAAATVTAWDPPRRFACEETVERGDGSTAPLATEFLVEARSGGTCIVRVVSGLSRDGEGWEDLVEGAGVGWRMALTLLRSYLTHFAGKPVAHLDIMTGIHRPLHDAGEVFSTLMRDLGLTGLTAGDPFRVPGDPFRLAGIVDHVDGDVADSGAMTHAPNRWPGDLVLLRTDEPCPGLVAISTLPMDGATLTLNVSGRLYGPDAAATAKRERPRWEAWLSDRFIVTA